MQSTVCVLQPAAQKEFTKGFPGSQGMAQNRCPMMHWIPLFGWGLLQNEPETSILFHPWQLDKLEALF